MRARVVVGILAVIAVVLAVLAWQSCGGSGGSGNRNTAGGSAGSTSTSASRAKKRSGPVVPASLAGRVTRADSGAGIAGARVSISSTELLAMFSGPGSQAIVVVTDASGGWKAPDVPPGGYIVAATASGFLPAVREKLVVASGEQRAGLDLALTAGGTLVRGIVTDVGGGPIADARITAAVSRNMPEVSGRPDFVAMTGADGRYELTLADGVYDLAATHDDYAADHESVEVIGSEVVVDFSLIPGATIRGVVVTRDGAPVPGAFVRAETRAQMRGDSVERTDDQGHFAVRGLQAGAFLLHAQGRGVASSTPTSVDVGIGEQVDGVRIVVDRAYSISGRVVRKGNATQGLPGVTLGAMSLTSKLFGLALEPTAGDGAFEIVGLRPASYMLFAVGEGSVPDVGKNVEIVDKDVEDIIVELGSGVTISGRVEPAAGAVRISISPAGGVGLANMFEAVKSMLVNGATDAGGAFTLKNVPAGTFKLAAHAANGHAGKTEVVVADVDVNGLVVRLETRGSVAGRVVDGRGQPVSGAHVNANRVKRDDEPGGDSISFGSPNRGSARSAADGTFKLVGLEAGSYIVRANLDDDRFGWVQDSDKASAKHEITLEVAATAEKTGVVLTVETHDGAIRGTVVGADGKGAADAWVVAHRASVLAPSSPDKPDGVSDEAMDEMTTRWGGTKPVLTDGAGRFTVGKLRKGTYTLVVTGPRGASRAEKRGVKIGENVTMKLASLGTLTGKVTVDGKPVSKYDIDCGSKADQADEVIAAVDGSYALERLAPGAYTCNVTSDLGSATGKVDVPAGPATLDLAVSRWASIVGTVVSVLDKTPVPGVLAFAGEGFASSNLEAVMTGKAPTTDASGRFTIPRVPSGKGTVSIMPKDAFNPLGTREYTAVPGQRIDLGTIEIVPPRNGDAGTFGFATNVDGDKLVVSSVKDPGPALAAGMQVGDRVIAINGRDVSASVLKPALAQTLLSSGTMGAGQHVQLSLDRAGSKLAVTLVSVKW